MNKYKVYIETSVISYLSANPSRDLIVAANQQITHEWWRIRRKDFDLYTSEIAIWESTEGDKQAAARRLNIIKTIEVVPLVREVPELASKFLVNRILPKKAGDDALHIALATVFSMDYLLTWNCKHIANAEIQKKVALVILEQGYDMPIICTPQELMGG